MPGTSSARKYAWSCGLVGQLEAADDAVEPAFVGAGGGSRGGGGGGVDAKDGGLADDVVEGDGQVVRGQLDLEAVELAKPLAAAIAHHLEPVDVAAGHLEGQLRATAILHQRHGAYLTQVTGEK